MRLVTNKQSYHVRVKDEGSYSAQLTAKAQSSLSSEVLHCSSIVVALGCHFKSSISYLLCRGCLGARISISIHTESVVSFDLLHHRCIVVCSALVAKERNDGRTFSKGKCNSQVRKGSYYHKIKPTPWQTRRNA
jgi:hypothetical protein